MGDGIFLDPQSQHKAKPPIEAAAEPKRQRLFCGNSEGVDSASASGVPCKTKSRRCL